MNLNETQTNITYDIHDYYIVCSLSGGFAILSIAICVMILILVGRTKPRLHTVNHLLLCNTSIASICYCIIINNNYIFLIFIPSVNSDISCRLRAYFAYISITAVVYSYVIQAISRLFFCLFTTKYRWLTSFKAHYCLIAGQWCFVFIVTSPAILTNDIVFYAQNLCWVPMDRTLHVAYTVFAYYIAPVLAIVVMYIFIYYRVRRTIQVTQMAKTIKKQKLDLELLRNILILVCTYLFGGLPFILFVITSVRKIYLINLTTISFAVFLEKLFTIILDREIRLVIRNMLRRRREIVPVENSPWKPNNRFLIKHLPPNDGLHALNTSFRY
uniref:7 transmembrane receptor (Rhodopsin family) D n=1 Tax=Philodina roseola TaxID=96448 RepID=B2L3M2_PHIRO|nr:7 transmembrane receptor (rhodopsin family) D [Philodina roseola]